MRHHALARFFCAAPNGREGEGEWIVRCGDASLVTTVQPSKDVPGESWIARAWHPGLGCFLGGGGQDALDAALAVVEDFYDRNARGNRPRVAITADMLAPRPHRADVIDACGAPVARHVPAKVDDESFGGDDDEAFG